MSDYFRHTKERVLPLVDGVPMDIRRVINDFVFGMDLTVANGVLFRYMTEERVRMDITVEPS